MSLQESMRKRRELKAELAKVEKEIRSQGENTYWYAYVSIFSGVSIKLQECKIIKGKKNYWQHDVLTILYDGVETKIEGKNLFKTKEGAVKYIQDKLNSRIEYFENEIAKTKSALDKFNEEMQGERI